MTIGEIRKKILESEDFILSETKKLQYTYGLKHETRYIIERNENITSESVAEHIYSLHIIADYFLPIEDSERNMDWNKVHNMVQYHDIDEIETGDKIGYLKTPEDRAQEAAAAERVVQNFPKHMQSTLKEVLDEYEKQESQEAKFTKALDRIEPLFQTFSENGKKVMLLQKTTAEQSKSVKEKQIKPFPYMYHFYRVVHKRMEDEGIFYKPE